jgi:hypothetical protein
MHRVNMKKAKPWFMHFKCWHGWQIQRNELCSARQIANYLKVCWAQKTNAQQEDGCKILSKYSWNTAQC